MAKERKNYFEREGNSYDTTSTKIRHFIDAMVELNGDKVEAAIRAGCKATNNITVNAYANRLLSQSWVVNEINKRINEYNQVADVAVLRDIAEIAFNGDIADFEDLNNGKTLKDLRREGINTKLIKTYQHETFANGNSKTRIELYARDAALDKLAKIRGLDKSDDTGDTTKLLDHILSIAAKDKPKVLKIADPGVGTFGDGTPGA